MGRIVQLDERLSNMIAAGEVVERPSSVVKELVENAIDAGAKNISITLIDSGVKEIIIEDDGCGMSRDDAKLCFSRHATSKIKNLLMSPPNNTKIYDKIVIPPLTALDALKFLDSYYGLYKNGSITFLESKP